MTVIRDDVFVLINTFRVDPSRQQELIDPLSEATEQAMKSIPGFVSATFHRSLDGRSVANYAQWRSKEDFDAMLQNPAAREHMGKAAQLAESFEPIGYEVAAAHGVRERA